MLRLTSLFLAVLCVAVPCVADEAKVALKIEFPEEVLSGTPPNVLVRLFPELSME